MAALLQKLPTILVLAVLVGIFLSLRRRTRLPAINLWTAAWFLIFLHFFVQLFERDGDASTRGIVLSSMDLSFLVLSGVVFTVSLTRYAERIRQALCLIVALGIPVVVAISADAASSHRRWIYGACALAIFGGTIVATWIRYPRAWFTSAALLAVAIWSLLDISRHHDDVLIQSMLTIGFAWSGLLYWKQFRVHTAGVLTSIFGFVTWGAVFPVGAALDAWWPSLAINPELWNVPKFFVAFGMILTLLEEKSHAFEESAQRERALNDQLQRFAMVTSHLISGVELRKVCDEVAHAIVETTTFQRAAVLLSNDDKTLYVAGCRGLSPECERELQEKAGHWTTAMMSALCRDGRRIGQSSYQLTRDQAKPYDPVASELKYDTNPYWQTGDELLVPLLSPRGAYVGHISLDDPRDPARVSSDEMSKIELLATDLAVTVENNSLQRQLIRSEKLAGLGQLVAGVAHEMNNPLTAVIGYSELLSDEKLPAAASDKLEKLSREAQRMKRIVDNLLRFARREKLERKVAALAPIVEEIIALREYHLQVRGVKVTTRIEPGLPQLALDEDQFKQIMLNLLNNAVDAVDDADDKQIVIEARRQGDRVLLRFQDSGPGFQEPHRVFDPFYTTKPVGKGTGLGLSICYGIVREHGGDIHVHNLSPRGAVVSIELPVIADGMEEAAAEAANV
jgi:two-component system, NtrC family, sensor kinase